MVLMELNSLIAAIPQQWKQRMRGDQRSDICEADRLNNLLKKAASPKTVYSLLVSDKRKMAKRWESWRDEINIELPYDEFLEGFQGVAKLTVVAKYRSFQYRPLKRAIPTNVLLRKWNVKESENCDRCKSAKETYAHIFYECPQLKNFWTDVQQFMTEHAKVGVQMT